MGIFGNLFGTQGRAEASKPAYLSTPPEGFTPTQIIVGGEVVGRTIFVPGQGIVIETVDTPLVKSLQEKQKMLLDRLINEPPEQLAERQRLSKQFYEEQRAFSAPEEARTTATLAALQSKRGISASDIGATERTALAESQTKLQQSQARQAELYGMDLYNQQQQSLMNQLGAVQGGLGIQTGLTQSTQQPGQYQQSAAMTLSQLAQQQGQFDAEQRAAQRQADMEALTAGLILATPSSVLSRTQPKYYGQTFNARPTYMQQPSGQRRSTYELSNTSPQRRYGI